MTPRPRMPSIGAAELAPDDAAPWVARGNLDLAQGDARSAIESYRAALARQPIDAMAQTNLGIAFAHTGDRVGALAAFERGAQLAPYMGEAWNGLGALRLADGDLHGAVAALTRGAALLPLDPRPTINLGRALEALGQFDDAQRAYRDAIRRAPANTAAAMRLARLQSARRSERHNVGPLARR